MSYISIIRNLHVLSAAIWLGMVVVMNLALVPATKNKLTQEEVNTLQPIIKRVVFLVSISAFMTSMTGGILLWIETKFDIKSMFDSNRGIIILIAGTIGFIITLFHFLGEAKLEKYLRKRFNPEGELVAGYKGIEFIPRLGLVIISAIFISMLIAVRGL